MHPLILYFLSLSLLIQSYREKKWLGWLKDLNQMAFGFHEV